MSRSLRVVLLVGCGLVAALEAPEAGAWLRDGISGAYAERAQPVPTAVVAPHAQLQAGLPFEPLLFRLAPLGAATHATLAVGR
jgi:hypothetical protein